MSSSAQRNQKGLLERAWVKGTMIGVLILLGVAFWWLTAHRPRVEAWVTGW